MKIVKTSANRFLDESTSPFDIVFDVSFNANISMAVFAQRTIVDLRNKLISAEPTSSCRSVNIVADLITFGNSTLERLIANTPMITLYLSSSFTKSPTLIIIAADTTVARTRCLQRVLKFNGVRKGSNDHWTINNLQKNRFPIAATRQNLVLEGLDKPNLYRKIWEDVPPS